MNCQKEPDHDLRVFPAGQLPRGAMTQAQFIESLRDLHRDEWNALVPRNKESLDRFQQVMRPAWRHTLQLEQHRAKAMVQSEKLPASGDFVLARVKFRRAGEDAAVLATYWAPPDLLTNRAPRLVVIAGSEETTSKAQSDASPNGLAGAILRQGIAVLAVNSYSSAEPPDQFTNFYCTYNRTKLQSRVRDLLTICASTETIDPRGPISFRVALAGTGSAGLWALLAAPGAEAAAADGTSLNSEDERSLLRSDVFCPGLLAMGGFETAPMLAPTHPLLLHNTGERFATHGIQSAYKAADASAKLRLHSSRVRDEEIAQWLARF